MCKLVTWIIVALYLWNCFCYHDIIFCESAEKLVPAGVQRLQKNQFAMDGWLIKKKDLLSNYKSVCQI